MIKLIKKATVFAVALLGGTLLLGIILASMFLSPLLWSIIGILLFAYIVANEVTDD